jgi:sortase A
MTKYRYLKAPPGDLNRKKVYSVSKAKKFTSIFSKALFISGIIIIANVLWPILSYELFTAPELNQYEFLSPVPASGQEAFNQSTVEKKDFTNPKNWFPEAPTPQKRESRITHYTISIPKFDIKDATVEINGENLKKSLIHYPGTALPGKVGATVIFGHSILPQFFNPQNYLSIFSLIPTLELGDEITVKFDGITYTYKVIDKVEVKPDNISVLEQPYDNEYLRLITCTPPGTYLRRGVITAALVN